MKKLEMSETARYVLDNSILLSDLQMLGDVGKMNRKRYLSILRNGDIKLISFQALSSKVVHDLTYGMYNESSIENALKIYSKKVVKSRSTGRNELAILLEETSTILSSIRKLDITGEQVYKQVVKAVESGSLSVNSLRDFGEFLKLEFNNNKEFTNEEADISSLVQDVIDIFKLSVLIS